MSQSDLIGLSSLVFFVLMTLLGIESMKQEIRESRGRVNAKGNPGID